VSVPDFGKLADELLADVARGDITDDTRELLSIHGRVMYADGLRAAAELVNREISELLDIAVAEVERPSAKDPTP
jgi:hypothetical protein